MGDMDVDENCERIVKLACDIILYISVITSRFYLIPRPPFHNSLPLI